MARPLSIDLRRAVAAPLEGGRSRHLVAARFRVAPSTVINWVRRFQATGSVAPGQTGGHKPKAIAGDPQSLSRTLAKTARNISWVSTPVLVLSREQ
jgi:transposase